MGIHGFAAASEFSPEEQSDEKLVLSLCSSIVTLVQYPFDFSLRITFQLIHNTVEISYQVRNLDIKTMPFGIAGALGAPITLPVMSVSAIAASILSIITGSSDRKVERIKKQVVKSIREFHQSEGNTGARNSTINDIMDNISSFMDSACSDMDSALAADIREALNK